jgi:glycolate oxidase FAD binding subunit
MAGDAVLRALAKACAGAGPATSADAVAGVQPRYTAAPATVAEASALLRAAAAAGLAVVPRGTGSKLSWGAPPARCDLIVDTGRLDQVLEHAAGDLVVRAQAGARMDRLAERLAEAGQQLAIDLPPGTDAAGTDAAGTGAAGTDAAGTGTVGGMLATGISGPRRLRYGSPRDLVIGITVIRADGTVARSGGKVVKNVAGYDLGKLLAGSYGTLGLIAEAAFRLHPLPAAAAFVTAEFSDAGAARQAVAAAAGSEAAPSAVEIDRPSRDGTVRVGVLAEGDEGPLAERCAMLTRALGGDAASAPTAPRWWGWPATGDEQAPGGTLIRVTFWAGALPNMLGAIDTAGRASGLDPAVGGSAAAGVIYAALAADTDPVAVTAFLASLRESLALGAGRSDAVPASDSPPAPGSAVVLHAPPEVRGKIDPWGPVPSLGLMRAVKDRFDPDHLLAPGRFAGGI